MRRKIILITIFIIALISLVLYRTFATDITMKETIGDLDLMYDIDINDTDGRTITVEAGKTKVFDIFIANKKKGNMRYALAYKPATTTDIKVLKLDTSKDDVEGVVEKDSTLQISLVIENIGTSDLTYSIIPVTGYVNGGDLIVPSGYTMISEEYTFAGPSDKTLKKLGLTAKEGTPDFSNMATTDEGIYSANDNYGTSYYFRGAVTNNYVKFAGYYFRIIRINGDGTIRMIYDGTTAHRNGENNRDRIISTRKFNTSSGYNAYVGYMYGIPGSSTYAGEHTNTRNSEIKTVVDDWYKMNILDVGYSDKIADTIYCNDRQVESGTGINRETTYYKANSRILDSVKPVLTCVQKNDAFTVSDTTKGNGALTYPVGLITADEVSMAGARLVGSFLNSNYYLYVGNDFWTMTPASFDGTTAYELSIMHGDGIGQVHNDFNSGGVRPVISLKADIELTGTGTKDDPFKVVTASDKTLAKLGLTAKEGTPDFGNSATTDEGVYSTTDDYGTSYYFRGAVTNNYVKFANKFWRIIRINGDGTIRMIYDGTTAHVNGESSADRQIGESEFNNSYEDNAYIGYMYGNSNANTYEDTHKNKNNSSIKIMIDNWYKTNIEAKGYSNKIADTIYCNDRQVASNSTSYGGYTSLGYGINKTVYSATSRAMTTNWGCKNTPIPKLACSQKNDAFTVDDEEKGNGTLTYPVGLITMDEVIVSGGECGNTNKNYYLYTGKYYWTMSPCEYNLSSESMFAVQENGGFSNVNYVTYNYGVRPVISLRNDVEITGTGTKDAPFTVK